MPLFTIEDFSRHQRYDIKGLIKLWRYVSIWVMVIMMVEVTTTPDGEEEIL